jgi:hypothetical protein
MCDLADIAFSENLGVAMQSQLANQKTIPLHKISLDPITFSAMSYFASRMNIPLNDAITLALQEWLDEEDYIVTGTEH